MTIDIQCAEAELALQFLADASVDSIVTDPPAGIGFMGKEWDGDKGGRDKWVAWLRGVMAECHRVLKPGGHALVWALPRTSHWTATAIEDAGFEIRDVVMHLFGTGFPKSLDVSKAIDKAAGAEREVVGVRPIAYPDSPSGYTSVSANSSARGGGIWQSPEGEAQHGRPVTAPATDAARQWSGWGTALKPAAEHWILARKPLGESTVAANVLEHGTGALNIDACRIACEGGSPSQRHRETATRTGAVPSARADGWDRSSAERYTEQRAGETLGRWPAHVMLDEDAAAALDEQSGTLAAGARPARRTGIGYKNDGSGTNDGVRINLDTGGASRFFYTAKPSAREKNRGCEDLLTWENVDLSPLTACFDELRKAMSDDTMQQLVDREWSTSWSGSSITEPSLTAIKCIIETVSRTTTESKTSSCSPRLSTSESIRAAIAIAKENGSSLAELAALTSRWTPASTSDVTASLLSVVRAVFNALAETSALGRTGNVHSTVKPIALMRWLVRLITPPGGTVLDPFAGSGTTALACKAEGFSFIGFEREAEYVEIIRKRLEGASE